MTKETETSYQGLRISFWCAAIALGAADAWASRFSVNPDGISYLDIGDAYWRGDWHIAINAYWSPLYSWVLGLFLKLLKPSPYWQYPLVHLINLLIYVAALACFEFFLRVFVRFQVESEKGAGETAFVTLPEWAWWALGYTLFIWTSLELITIKVVSPDMCVAGFVYLISGLILRIRDGAESSWTFAAFGVVLGLAYLAKAVMFPLAFIFLAVAALSSGSTRKAAPRVAMSALVFLVVASPFVTALSRAKGRLTFGDSGKVAYEVYINGVDQLFPENASLKHPLRKPFEMPATYEFGKPVGGTYPPWYDSTYWHEGIEPHFDVKGAGRSVTFALIVYGWLFFNVFMELNVTAGLLVLYFLSPRPSQCLRYAAATWPFLLPAVAAFGLYALVYTEYRYIAAFVLLFWMAAFSGVRLSPRSRTLVAGVVTAIVATCGISAMGYTLHNLADSSLATPISWQAASSLGARGVRPHDKLALLWNEKSGKEVMWGTFVARLAKVQIVAEVPRPDDFWSATSDKQFEVVQAISRSGAKAILTLGEPRDSTPHSSWERLGSTNYYVCLLDTGNP